MVIMLVMISECKVVMRMKERMILGVEKIGL
jgi:hypothetical protein